MSKKETQNRFVFNCTFINGYWGIEDREDDDNIIWIDCKEEFLPVILKALNDEFG